MDTGMMLKEIKPEKSHTLPKFLPARLVALAKFFLCSKPSNLLNS